ncbi:MAG: RnfABCDGE type electron transport complex subunit G [Bacteroidales bacterium]|nr:RnfABCDGE type electron transport complex subunit G [Bacteroidales bacterium]MBN2821503.1 RnfABCDGE type electron transport complex subunit G [Bacteroidales bacterium]
MAKKESTFLSMVLTLFLVTLGASAALGYVYELTKDAIADAESAKKSLAVKRVVPEFNNNPTEEFIKIPAETEGDTLYFYVARMNDDTVGYAIETYSKKAFGGLLKLLVGLKPDGTINNVAVLEHKETPGLGTKMTEEKFSSQFPDKNPAKFILKVKKDGGDVDAITASTITSRAYCDAVQRAFSAYTETQTEKGGMK